MKKQCIFKKEKSTQIAQETYYFASIESESSEQKEREEEDYMSELGCDLGVGAAFSAVGCEWPAKFTEARKS